MSTIVNERFIWHGVPMVYGPVEFSGRWKTVIENGEVHLEFENKLGRWIDEARLIVVEREEYLNGVEK